MRCASGHQPEQRAVAVEAPRPPLGNDLEPGLVVAVEQFVGDRAGRRLVGQLERFRAEPLHADDRDQAVGMHAADGVTGLQIFKLHDSLGRLASAGGAPTDARFLGSASRGSSDVVWHSPCGVIRPGQLVSPLLFAKTADPPRPPRRAQTRAGACQPSAQSPCRAHRKDSRGPSTTVVVTSATATPFAIRLKLSVA